MLRLKSLFPFPKELSKTLVVVPLYNEYGLLRHHIELLNSQTTNDFDLLVVAEPSASEAELRKAVEEAKPSFNVLVFRREKNSGPAGGMFVGEAFAVEKGYENIIYADVDCLPIDERAVESLLSSLSENRWVMLTQHAISDDGRAVFIGPSGINHYSALKVSKLKEIGFRYLPLYYVDDVEFAYRVKQSVDEVVVKQEVCTHPNKPYNWIENRPNPVIFYAESSLLRFQPTLYLNFLLLSFVLRQPFLWFFANGMRWKALQEFWAFLISFLPSSVGKKVLERISWRFNPDGVDPEGERVKLLFPNIKKQVPYSHYIPKIFSEVRNYFGKKVCIESYDSWIYVLLLAMIARKLYVRLSSGKYVLLADNPLPAWLLKLVAAAVSLPFFVLISAVVSVLKLLLIKPLHFKYGLEESLQVEESG